MDLTMDEQRLIAGFRKLTPSGRDELLAFAASLTRRSNAEEPSKGETATNQCKLKNREPHPEAEKSPYFTE